MIVLSHSTVVTFLAGGSSVARPSAVAPEYALWDFATKQAWSIFLDSPKVLALAGTEEAPQALCCGGSLNLQQVLLENHCEISTLV